MTVLETFGLTRSFGGVRVAASIDFRLAAGSRHALIGPNGAGKTSFVGLLSGTLRPDAGRIALGRRDITRLPPSMRARLGLSRSFQINQLFASLTPAESIRLAVQERSGPAEQADALLERFSLIDLRDRPTAQLSYGQQRLLELALALAGNPDVLLLDEPAAGLSDTERRELIATLSALPRSMAVLMIEHDMDMVFAFADRISVMADGAIIAEGTPAEISANETVRQVYLGAGHD